MTDDPAEADLFTEIELEQISTHLEQLSKTLPRPFKDLGSTLLARQLGLSEEQLNGHWCSRCQGIWFGYTLEVECPACGNRNG